MRRKSVSPFSMLFVGSFMLLSLASCSSKSATTTTTTQTPAATTYDFYVAPDITVPDSSLDGVTSATLDEEEGHNSSYKVFYQNSGSEELLLDSYPSADYLVFQALSTPYVFDSDVPIDVIHQTVKESLGSRYDAVRESYTLVDRDDYYNQLASSDNPTAVMAQYGLTINDLKPSWYQGLSATETANLKEVLLDYYCINDLIYTGHYSAVSGMEAVIAFSTKLAEVNSYLSGQSSETQSTVKAFLSDIRTKSTLVSSSDYDIMLTDSITVKDLVTLASDVESRLNGSILADSRNLAPERIGYYSTSAEYGISVIESIQTSVGSGIYSNVTETLSSDNVSSKSARLYLPEIGTEKYYILTLQEIKFDEEHIYSYVNVETASISTFNTLIAQDLHKHNAASISTLYNLVFTDAEVPVIPEDTEVEDSHDDEEQDDHHGDDDHEDLDGVTSATPEFVTLSTPNASGGMVDVTVPHFPEKVAFLDYVSFDMAACIGYSDRFERLVIQDDMPAGLRAYLSGDENLSVYMNAGDLSLLENFQPDVIFANKNSAWLYDQLSAIAPVIMTDIDDSRAYASFLENLARLAIVFSVQDNVDEITVGYDARLADLRTKTDGKTAIVASVSEGVMTVETEYATMIFQDVGFTNAASHLAGQTLSIDTVNSLGADYLFILDTDNSFSTIDIPAVLLTVPCWTLLDGGLLGMDQMIYDIESNIS